ncbi:hypothetical protein VTN49DRAFT_2671 [Thermomyces lanuginosus]|uniref:uncharacterized protein n=1 Tax=Thermomyces lanuginosus TaxID=5541 RepID=UPI003743B6E7
MASKPIVLITGANQGIGFEVARQLLSAGTHHVLLGARSPEKAEAAVQQLHSIVGPDLDLTPFVIDVTNDSSINAAAQFVNKKFKKIDILINNAGISGETGPVANLPHREKYRAVFETNVFGVAAVIEAFLPLLRQSDYHDRRIVDVTSGLSQIDVAYSPNTPWGAHRVEFPFYRASKAALNMLTAVYAGKLKKEGILVVAVAPGYTKTAFTEYQGEKPVSQGARNVVRAATEGDPEKLYGTLVAEELTEYGW